MAYEGTAYQHNIVYKGTSFSILVVIPYDTYVTDADGSRKSLEYMLCSYE